MNFESKKNLYIAVTLCCIAVPLILLLIYYRSISSFAGAVLSVLNPIIIGAALAYILNPLLNLFELKVLKKLRNKRMRRSLALLMTYIVALVALASLAFLMIPQLIKSITDLSAKFDSYISSTTEFINNLTGKFTSEHIDTGTLKNIFLKFFPASGNALDTVAEYVKKYGMAVVNAIKNIFLALFISVYMLAAKEKLLAQVKKCSRAFLGEKKLNILSLYLGNTNKTFIRFFTGTLTDALIVGCITLVALLIFRVPYALLIAVTVGVTNIIPVFGPFIGAIPSAFIIFIAEPKKALIFIIFIIVLQQIDGNIIAPAIIGNSTGLSSLGVIVAITVMGSCFGIIGMVVGVPLFAVITEILKEFIETKLKVKNLSTDTADYYPRTSLVDPHEHHESFSSKIFAKIRERVKNIKTRNSAGENYNSTGGSEKNKKEKEVDYNDKRDR